MENAIQVYKSCTSIDDTSVHVISELLVNLGCLAIDSFIEWMATSLVKGSRYKPGTSDVKPAMAQPHSASFYLSFEPNDFSLRSSSLLWRASVASSHLNNDTHHC